MSASQKTLRPYVTFLTRIINDALEDAYNEQVAQTHNAPMAPRDYAVPMAFKLGSIFARNDIVDTPELREALEMTEPGVRIADREIAEIGRQVLKLVLNMLPEQPTGKRPAL